MSDAIPVSHPDGGADEDAGGFSRRRALGLATAGAVAWTVPTVITVEAAAAATCFATTVTWSDYDATIADYPDSWPFFVPIGLSSDIEVGFDDSGTGAGTGNAGYADLINPLGGASTSYIVLELEATATGQYVELELVFSSLVSQLSFTLLDVDRGLGRWQDQVQLRATRGGLPVPAPTVTPGSLDLVASPIVDGVQVLALTDPSGVGDGTANNATTANALVDYGVGNYLDRLVIRYEAGPDEGVPQRQQIGITDMFMCVAE